METICSYRNLSDRDLVCSLLRISSDTISGDSISEIIDHLLKHSSKPDQVMMVKEIAERYGTKSLKKGDSFNNASQVYYHYRPKLGGEKQEHFYIVILDNKHRIIAEKMVSLGTINKSIVHPREVFAPAIEHRAAAIILVHNHPSGDPQPSNQDIEITKRLAEVGEIVGIKILDHAIVCADSFFSFVDEDIMP